MILLLGALVALGCGCGSSSRQGPLTASEYRRQANALCAGRPGDMANLKPPPHLQALHDRATALSDKGNRADRRRLAAIYSKLELPECVRMVTPDPGDPATCREIVSLTRDAHEERRSWVEEVRAEEEMVKEIENELREFPENRKAAQADLDSSRRLAKEAEREVEKAERDLERLDADAREEGCAK